MWLPSLFPALPPDRPPLSCSHPLSLNQSQPKFRGSNQRLNQRSHRGALTPECSCIVTVCRCISQTSVKNQNPTKYIKTSCLSQSWSHCKMHSIMIDVVADVDWCHVYDVFDWCLQYLHLFADSPGISGFASTSWICDKLTECEKGKDG